MVKSDFFISLKKFGVLTDKSVDWFLRASEFKKKSLERQICYLKQKLYWRDAKKYLRKANKCLN